MDIYALLVYEKNSSSLSLSEKCFIKKENAVDFLKNNNFIEVQKDSDIFTSSKHFCRIKKIRTQDELEPEQLSI